MVVKRKDGAVLDIITLFEQELQTRNEDLRRQAALSMLSKLRPSARVTMAEFLDTLQQHKDVWMAVLGMSVVEFALNLSGRPHSETLAPTESRPKRTRISDAQKNSIKGAIVSVLGNHHHGLNRADLAGQIADNVLATIGIKREELADKLRQPLGELVADKKIHTVGEKQRMKYHAGAKK